MRKILYVAPLAVLIASCACIDRGVPVGPALQSPRLLEPAALLPEEASLNAPKGDLAKTIVQDWAFAGDCSNGGPVNRPALVPEPDFAPPPVAAILDNAPRRHICPARQRSCRVDPNSCPGIRTSTPAEPAS
jgi:hypothetical protein